MTSSQASRRTLLAGFVAAAAGAPLLNAFTAAPAYAADSYLSNTRLYADPANVEGVDFARRFKRHEMLDTSRATTPGPRLSTVMAIHGGGIEPGTSELCLAIAGYRPDTLEPAAAGAPLHDYWMFEGLRSSGAVPGNGDLHVTSTHNDDPVARSLAAGSANVLSLHGCTAVQAGLPAGTKGLVVGGGNGRLRTILADKLDRAGFVVAPGDPEQLNGDLPENICNRTLTGEGGGQLELTYELRRSLFGDFAGAPNASSPTKRAQSTNTDFWKFTDACRAALAQMESEQLARASIFDRPAAG
ncbi:poly-gamma-glutamate hydrolase family protein [Streptomyces sp. A0592]|uniref:poly-gamma-glutamate hydrolase family protein n=1 Tax=Streptomyces sp. A0592 TaxID=2563099 RepID=UPI00109E4223|nr:poly-gamma-glutamate hydrolase family protein [Streptomyces sp. A0592]THA86620.1 phage replication protein [Streptomyces sp. A0592]